MKYIRVFLFENLQFLVVKFSIYLNRRVFVMKCGIFIQYKIMRPKKQTEIVIKKPNKV